jgi:hypothetical protein
MRITFDKWFRVFLILAVSLCLTAGLALAKDKNIEGASTKDLTKPSAAGNAVINIGAVKNYFTASTITKGGGEEQTFLIGADDLSEPSMMWDEGGYAENHYLYFGNVRMGVLNDEIRFSSLTTDDWTVFQNDPDQVAPYVIYFSMTDEFAGALKRDITASQTVYAWSESYRDDFYILEYDITNTGGIDYTDFYVWMHMDCDISSPGGGSDVRAFYRDDLPNYYKGTDANGKAETLSYMFDGDNPEIEGDDTGGNRTPKESLGYLGSRILESPPLIGDATGATANQQSGHQWWDWNSDPEVGGQFYNLAKQQEFKVIPGSPHDYRYMQTLGPFELKGGQTIKIVFAFGLGEGEDGLRENLQWAYDLYWNDWQGPAAPQAPNMTLTSGDGFATVTWDSVSENSRDPLTGEQDFQGYRLYRSLDKSAWTLLGEWDLIDNQGANTGLPPFNAEGVYEYVDRDVTNGYVYFYTVTSYDKGSADLPSLENGKSVDYSAQPGPLALGTAIDEEQIQVVPNPFIVKAPWDFTPTKDNPAEERIQFQGIPKNSKVTVFNLAGDMIIELEQEGDQGWVDWDLITRNRQKIVSGLYLFVVEAPEGDNYIGKFVVVR